MRRPQSRSAAVVEVVWGLKVPGRTIVAQTRVSAFWAALVAFGAPLLILSLISARWRR